MTTDSNDDRELDDPALRSMRAVWLSMREEEPPAAGLSALLAAARIKAEAMQPKEPWWRRALLAMRRPPALAFATVLVLLGGAVLVGSQREKLDAMPKVERADRMEVRAVPTRAALDDGHAAPAELAKDHAAPDSPSKGSAGSAAVAADPADVAPADPSRPATADVVAAVPERIAAADSGAPAGRPAGPATPAPRPIVPPPPPGAESEGLASALPRPPPPAPPPPSSAQRENAGGVPPTADSDRGPEGGKRKNALDQAPAPAPAMAPKITRQPPPKQDLQIADDAGTSSLGEVQTTGAAQSIRNSGSDEERAESKSVRGPTLGQLAKQSETAASRGDCPAVRAIVGRIRKLDAEFHKKHVQANAAVKRCVK